ncbi:MAG: type II secretion system protein GspG, partial [Candidatus Binatia bacterium]
MSPRIQCLACGTFQEAPRESGAARCGVCGVPLGSSGAEPARSPVAEPRAADASRVSGPSGDVFELKDESGRVTALPAEAPVTRPVEVDEILAGRKRLTSLISLVPVAGLWTLWRSDSHDRGEKLALSLLSLALTAFIAFAVFAALPGPEDRLAALDDRLELELGRLVALVEQYRSENGSYPDEATWALSIGRRDPRFVDPWGRPYAYERRDGGFTVGTLGRDGASGGEGEDRDR